MRWRAVSRHCELQHCHEGLRECWAGGLCVSGAPLPSWLRSLLVIDEWQPANRRAATTRTGQVRVKVRRKPMCHVLAVLCEVAAASPRPCNATEAGLGPDA
jgi:hypothetical protein